MERKITKCFSRRKADMTVTNDCSIVKDRCNMLHIDLLVSKAMMLLVFLTFSFATLAAKSHITDTRYDIEGVETGLQGTYLVKVYVYTKKSSVTTEEFKFAAVHGVIFRGFERKGFGAQKPIANAEAQTQHADFFNAFFQQWGLHRVRPGGRSCGRSCQVRQRIQDGRNRFCFQRRTPKST